MYRGTTPTITFKTDISLATITELTIVFKQSGKIRLEKYLTDCTLDSTNKTISVTLTEYETLDFIPNKDLHIQVIITLNTGKKLASTIMGAYIENTLEEEYHCG